MQWLHPKIIESYPAPSLPKYVGIAVIGLLFFSCNKFNPVVNNQVEIKLETPLVEFRQELPPFDTFVLDHDVRIKGYFEFMDSLVAQYDTLVLYPISEHIIVHANPWLIERLENTDYYRLMTAGFFTHDQKSLRVLQKNDILIIPNEIQAESIINELNNIVLDLNIPEFKLRIFNGKDTLYSFPVRVGQNKSRHLAMNDRETDLRTVTGTGSIVRINKNPSWIDPVDNKVYKVTHRDDGRTTLLPRIPWLEPKLNGKRLGQFIHPTTNPKSLGKAYSNGCIGTREADAWRIYYYAPVGTKVVVRYDLEVVNAQGDTLQFKDIYKRGKRRKRLE